MATKVSLQFRNGRVFQMTVPKWVADHLKWNDKDTLLISVYGNAMRVRREEAC